MNPVFVLKEDVKHWKEQSAMSYVHIYASVPQTCLYEAGCLVMAICTCTRQFGIDEYKTLDVVRRLGIFFHHCHHTNHFYFNLDRYNLLKPSPSVFLSSTTDRNFPLQLLPVQLCPK